MTTRHDTEGYVRRETVEPRPAPAMSGVPFWRGLFGSAANVAATLVIAAVLLTALPHLLSWAVVHGVWSGNGQACREAGACWAFLRAKYPMILFGIYPADERWRPIVAIVVIFALTLWTLPCAHWTRTTLGLWIGGTAAALLLMGGGFLGLAPVPTSAWGGLPITLLLTVLSLGLGFPMAIALALGRQATLPIPRYLSIGIIEVVRGMPLLSILFIASILLPLMLPEGFSIDKFARALAALTIFSAAYIAEVLRGGLQGVPKGQAEAARALGLNWLQMTRAVILPQAIQKVIPPLTSTVVVVVKNTSLVLVVGLFDLLSSGRAALADPLWPAPYTETYIMIAAIYFVICFGISRYALRLEQTIPQGNGP